jgi:site-specific DNA recombinase
MTTTFTKKKGRTYRYYLCGHAAKHGRDTCPLCVVPAGDLEGAVLDQVRLAVRAPEVRTQALAIIQRHEEEDRKALAAEKDGLEAELATLTATASRMLHGPQAQASADFVVSELARIDGQVGQIRDRLAAVNTELDGLVAQPTTDASLAAELATFDRIWAELVPAEQERLVHLVVERVTVHQDGLDLALRADGVAGVVRELRGAREGIDRNGGAVGAGLEVAHG